MCQAPPVVSSDVQTKSALEAETLGSVGVALSPTFPRRTVLQVPLAPGQKHVAVIGAGFAGLEAAKLLAKDPRLFVTLVDRKNHHLFQPLLYQVATAALNPADIAVPIRAQFARKKNVQVYLAQAEQIDLAARSIDAGALRIPYDYLILAAGAQHSYFDKPEWEDFAPGLKTLEHATEIRRRILMAFELAENEPDPERQRALLNFVVVGAGPTGVELAGAIADISRNVLLRDFRRIDPAQARIILIEAGDRVLSAFPQKLGERAARDLVELGVEVRLGMRVQKIDAKGVELGGTRIAAETVIWAAGVEASSLAGKLGVELDRAGRIRVKEDLSIPGYPEAFAVGDITCFDLGGGASVPGLAPAAIQMGRAAAQNVQASVGGRSRVPFRYRDKGLMATIGKHKAVAKAGRLELAGFLAWLAWLLIHVLYLIGFKNRIMVFLEWAWSYAFSKRGSRLITSRDWRSP